MIRLHPAIGAAAFAIAALALPTFAISQNHGNGAITHRDTRGQIDAVSLKDVVQTAQAQGDSLADGLPTSWCGNETTTDDTADAATAPAKAQFKVVYAYAADQPDRFAGWKDAIQANAAVVERFLSSQDGGTKALRLDMGTSCGPQYVDIQTVQLPGPRSSYADNFSAIESVVQRAIATTAGPRDAMVYADGLSGSTQEYGLGETVMGPTGEVPGASNVHNRGGLTSVLFSRNGAAAPGAAKWGWWPEGMLHEATHNLGAVEWGAPHSTEPAGQSLPQYGHCWQGYDVMCYVEDSGASHAMQYDCPSIAGAIPEAYDCGRDDYFNPAPAPGSYLATHWNTYNSAFLAPCGEIVPACGGGEAWVPTPPAASSPPLIQGALRRGSTLTALPGTWANAPSGYTYQWQLLSSGTWSDIDGATAATYVVSGDDIGRPLRVQVVATNDDGTASAASVPTGMIGASAVNRAASSTSSKGKKAISAKAAKKAKAAKAAKKAKAAKARKKATAARKKKATAARKKAAAARAARR